MASSLPSYKGELRKGLSWESSGVAVPSTLWEEMRIVEVCSELFVLLCTHRPMSTTQF